MAKRNSPRLPASKPLTRAQQQKLIDDGEEISTNVRVMLHGPVSTTKPIPRSDLKPRTPEIRVPLRFDFLRYTLDRIERGVHHYRWDQRP